jgi:osmotically inducible protein OsmC
MNPGTSTAHARWTGSLADGSGTVSTESAAIKDAQLTWKSRIGETPGTTPEELLAAGHAGCYSMALSGALAKAGHAPEQLEVDATFTFGPVDGGFGIHGISLTVEGIVPGIDEAEFLEQAEGAKVGCPVSKAFAGNVPIELEARLLQHA